MKKKIVKLIGFLFVSLFLFACNDDKKSIKNEVKKVSVPIPVPIQAKKKMSVQAKKKKFIQQLVPVVQKVHYDLLRQYERVAQDIQDKKNTKEIQALKARYKTNSDEDLLVRLKLHPVSITLAQAAMESSWATSRFFTQANNVFGMWSSNANEPRIAAGEKRGGTRTIWLRKFNTVEDSVRAYYEMMAKGKTYKEFRQLRLEYDDPYKITKGLDKYSEIGPAYIKAINQVIKYNHFRKYDP